MGAWLPQAIALSPHIRFLDKQLPHVGAPALSHLEVLDYVDFFLFPPIHCLFSTPLNFPYILSCLPLLDGLLTIERNGLSSFRSFRLVRELFTLKRSDRLIMLDLQPPGTSQAVYREDCTQCFDSIVCFLSRQLLCVSG